MTPGMGKSPAIGLIDPKYPHNAAAALRTASCFGFSQLWLTGKRATSSWDSGNRLHREERMRMYLDVEVFACDYFLDAFTSNVTVVGVEVMENAIPLPHFAHPDEAVYVFGPEDDGIPKGYRAMCHQFVIIPTRHCLNLAVAVGVIAASRQSWRIANGDEEVRPSYQTLDEQRGWADVDGVEE